MKSIGALQSLLSLCLLFAAGPAPTPWESAAVRSAFFAFGEDLRDFGGLSPELTERNQESAQAREPPVNDSDDALLQRVSRHVLDFASQLPDFVVNEEITRYANSPRSWVQQDTLELEVTYESGKGERPRLLKHNGRPTDEDYARLGGPLAFGVFSKSLPTLFHPATNAEFKRAEEHKRFRSRDVLIYRFSVPQSRSRLTLGVNGSGKSIFAAYTGLLWVDPQTQQVVRIEQSSSDIPASSPAALKKMTVEYNWVTVGGERLMLPVHAEIVLSRTWAGLTSYSRSVIKFSDYRKFGGEIKLEATPPPKN